MQRLAGRCLGSVDVGRQDADAEHRRNLRLARLDCAAAERGGYFVALRQRLVERTNQIDKLLAVLAAQDDPSIGQPRPGPFGFAAERLEVVVLKGRGRRKRLRHGNLLAQKGIDGVEQCSRGIEDRVAAIVAFVIGELPDDTCRQQEERHRNRERHQHQRGGAIVERQIRVGAAFQQH